MTMEQMMAYNVNENTQVSRDGGPWAPLYTYPELMKYIHDRRCSMGTLNEMSSQRVLCGVFAIILGYLGVQYFIIGKTAGGFLSILLSLVTCGLWSIVTLIQGIMMLTMSDENFKRTYIDSTSVMPLW